MPQTAKRRPVALAIEALSVKARSFGGFAVLAIFSALLRAQPTEARQPSWFPKVSCKEAWSKLIPKNEHHYDFRRDARPEVEGNTGYESYARRVRREDCYKEWSVLV